MKKHVESGKMQSPQRSTLTHSLSNIFVISQIIGCLKAKDKGFMDTFVWIVVHESYHYCMNLRYRCVLNLRIRLILNVSVFYKVHLINILIENIHKWQINYTIKQLRCYLWNSSLYICTNHHILFNVILFLGKPKLPLKNYV